MKIGDTLKEAREARGLDLYEIAEETKIRLKYLEALEEERFDLLPENVYIKGFIRIYAKHLGINAEPLIAFLGQRQKEEQKREKQITVEKPKEVGPAPTERKPFLSWKRKALYIFIVLLTCFLAFKLFVHLRGVFPQQAPQKTNIQSESERQSGFGQNNGGINQSGDSVASPSPVNGLPLETEQKNLNLILNVVRDRCWVNVEVDGETKFTGELTAYQARSFHGQDRIVVKLGNAGAVQVQLNGRDLGFLGETGKVVLKEFLAAGEG